MKPSKHLLVIRLSAMGDVAMTLPVVYAFAKANSEVTITYLSKPFMKPLVTRLPNVSFFEIDNNGRHKGVLGLWRLAQDLKSKGITEVADLHNVLRSKILKIFLRLPSRTINKGRAQKKALTKAKNKVFKPLQTTLERYTEVLQYFSKKPLSIEALPKETPTTLVQQFTGVDTLKWIGIAPYAAHQGKQYPIALMQEVITALDALDGVRLFLFGAPSEKDALQALQHDCSSTTIVAGALKFTQEINLISQLDVMLSMDSGNGHIAALFAVPTVTLWGVTHPYAGFAPFNQEAHCLVSDREKYPKIPTSVYGNKVPEGYHEVMHTITPTAVIQHIKKALA